MTPRLWKRLRLLPLLVIAVLVSLLTATPPAYATTGDNQYFELTYDCLQGQTATFVPGQVRVGLAEPDTYATIVSDRLEVWPVEQQSGEGYRSQFEELPGTQSNLQPELGLVLNTSKTIWFAYTVRWEGSTGTPEYLPSQVQCTGTPTDTDGDGVPDEIDGCPNLAAPESPDGCPSGVTISVVDTKAPNQAAGTPGAATVSITNVADGGGTESYQVWLDAQSHTVELGEGSTSGPLTFTGLPGDWNICAQSSIRAAKSCVMVTVPNEDPVPEYAGTVSYTQTCSGLRYTLTNTGRTALKVSVMLTYTGNSLGTVTEWSLAPGASKTATTPQYYNATIKPTLYSMDYASYKQVLLSKRWVVPSTCPVWMVGGTKLIRWGAQLTRYNARPRAVISTRAYHAMIGYQIKGSSRIHWTRDYYSQGRHVYDTMLNVRRGRQVTIRLWVRYSDSSESTTYGKTAFTTYHTFKRP